MRRLRLDAVVKRLKLDLWLHFPLEHAAIDSVMLMPYGLSYRDSREMKNYICPMLIYLSHCDRRIVPSFNDLQSRYFHSCSSVAFQIARCSVERSRKIYDCNAMCQSMSIRPNHFSSIRWTHTWIPRQRLRLHLNFLLGYFIYIIA